MPTTPTKSNTPIIEIAFEVYEFLSISSSIPSIHISPKNRAVFLIKVVHKTVSRKNANKEDMTALWKGAGYRAGM